MEDCAARKEGEYQPTASTMITEPPHVEPDEEKLHAQDEGGRQTERHLVPVEDSKPPPEDDFGDFQDDEDFGDFEAAAKEPPAEVVCDRFQRPLAPLSKAQVDLLRSTLFSEAPIVSDDISKWKYDDRFSVLRSIQSGPEFDAVKKQGKMLEEYQTYQRNPTALVHIRKSPSPKDAYGVSEKVYLETDSNGSNAITTPDIERYFLNQCRLFTSEVWPEMSLRSLYFETVTPVDNLRSEEAELQTIETQPTMEPMHTALDLGSEGKELDSSYLGTLPGASFIMTESAPSLRELLGESIPDLSFVLSPTVCSRV